MRGFCCLIHPFVCLVWLVLSGFQLGHTYVFIQLSGTRRGGVYMIKGMVFSLNIVVAMFAQTCIQVVAVVDMTQDR